MSRRQRGRMAPSQPLWMRVLASLCLALVAAVGTAQAVHVHGDWLPKNAAKASVPADATQGQGEEHCPLCVAMHTALPASLQVVPEPVEQAAQRLTAQTMVAQQRLRVFAMFSRPPPVAVRALASTMHCDDVSFDAAAAG